MFHFPSRASGFRRYWIVFTAICIVRQSLKKLYTQNPSRNVVTASVYLFVSHQFTIKHKLDVPSFHKQLECSICISMLTYEKNIYVNWFGHKVVIIENVKWNEVLKAHKKMYLLIILNPNLNQIKVNCLLSYHKKTVYIIDH